MAQKLKFRPVIGAPTTTGSQASITLSPTGRFIHLYDSSAITQVWRWDGTNYQSLGTGLADGLQAGEFTEDETYLVGLNSGTTQRVQLRSVNTTTGATTILSGLPSSSLPLNMNAVVTYVGSNYFVCWNRNVAAATIYLLKLNRTTNQLALVHSIPISDIIYSLQSYAFKVPGKLAVMYAQRLDTSFGVNFLRINTSNDRIETPTATIATTFAQGAFTSFTISDDARFWYGQHPSNPALSKRGTINVDGLSMTVDGSVPPAPQDGVYSSFVFGSTGLFTPKVTSGGPYDRYQVFNPTTGVLSANTGSAFGAMDVPAGPFSTVETRRNYDSTLASPRKFAMMTNRIIPVNPGFYVYEEGFEPTTTNLFALAPIGDAFVTTVPNLTMTGIAAAPIGDAFARVIIKETAAFVATAPMADSFSSLLVDEAWSFAAFAPMADAIMRASDQHMFNVAESPMGDAFAPVVVRESVSFFALAPMSDAWSSIQVNDAVSASGSGPMADSWVLLSDQNVSFGALAPMAEAWGVFSDERVTFAAIAPMADAWSSIQVLEKTTLVALAPFGDALV